MNVSHIVIAIGILVALVFLVLILRKRKLGHLKRSLEMSLFLIRLPRYETNEKGEGGEVKNMIARIEQFYANFIDIDRQTGILKRFFQGLPRVTFEIASELGGNDISFYIAIPLEYESSLNKYVQGVYPGAILEKKSEDYTVFEPGGEVAASYLKLKHTFYAPINTYRELGGDPLESVTSSLSNIASSEGAAVQITIRPVPFDFRNKGEAVLSQIVNEGKTLSQAVSMVHGGILSILIAGSSKVDKDAKKERKVDDAVIEAVRTKIKKPAFSVNVRLVGVAKTKSRAREVLHSLESGFSQFSSGMNGFNIIEVKGKRKMKRFTYDFAFRNFQGNMASILNSEELASIYHFPLSHMESPYIKWVKTKEAPPPSELPKEGEVFIGEAVYRGDNKPVYVATLNDRRRHFYVIGQTGTGKTSLLRDMIRQDIENGKGVGVIDPHGDLVEDTLANIPKERIDDVILFEPSDLARPCGLNMLEWNEPEQKDLAIAEMIMIFTSLFPPEFIGPYFEQYMRNAMLALMGDKSSPGTLVEIPRMFTDDQFMEKKLEKVTDPLVRNFWLRQWKQTVGQTRSDMLGYVTSKIGRFIENEMMRNIIGQSKSGFDLSEVMDNKKIFLANLSKGLTGEINSSLLGLILVSKMQMAALRRARMPEEQRQDFYLYIDEFQNFTTNSIATILSEARKYRLCLILAHQYMPQLKDEIKNAVIGNVGAIASYRIGVSDAEFLENQFKPEFSKFDLGNIDNFQYIVKMLINNKVASPFKVKAPVPVPGRAEMAEMARKISRLKYGRSKVIVEDEIIERSRLGM